MLGVRCITDDPDEEQLEFLSRLYGSSVTVGVPYIEGKSPKMDKRVRHLSIGADEMDRRQSAARRLNRNENNRLRQQHEQFRDNQAVIAVEIDQKMKKIQNELHGIREITGYEAYARTSGDETQHNSARYLKNDGKRKKKQRMATMQRRSKDRTETKSRKRTALGQTQVADSKSKLDENSSLMRMGSGDHLSRHLGTGHNTNAPKSQTTASTRRVTRVTFSNDKEEKLPQLVVNATTDSRSLLELDVSEARTQARKRILGENEIKGENTNEVDSAAASVDDVESYMYVPPDGRKRTVYLMPPLEDLLKEARKARYLRMPKRLDDEEDPEKELSVDEIFS